MDRVSGYPETRRDLGSAYQLGGIDSLRHGETMPDVNLKHQYVAEFASWRKISLTNPTCERTLHIGLRAVALSPMWWRRGQFALHPAAIEPSKCERRSDMDQASLPRASAGMVRFPVGPLLDYLRLRIGPAGPAVGYSQRQAYRWRYTGIQPTTADRVATRLGLHPSNLWADWYERMASR